MTKTEILQKSLVGSKSQVGMRLPLVLNDLLNKMVENENISKTNIIELALIDYLAEDMITIPKEVREEVNA